ncbi:MAG: NrsF family protein [Kofleriaceae bacterium]
MNRHDEPALEALAGARPHVPAMSAALRAEVGDRRAVRTRLPWRQLAILVTASLLYAGGVLAILRVRADVSEVPFVWIAGVASAWFLGFTATLALILVPRRDSMFVRWGTARGLAIVVAIAFVALGLLVHPSGPSSLIYGWEHFLRGHVCLEIGLGVALVPILIGAIAMRRAHVVKPRTIAFALGAGSGCLGGLLLHFFCKIADGPHIGLIHGGVVGVAAVVTALVVPRFIDAGRRNIPRP